MLRNLRANQKKENPDEEDEPMVEAEGGFSPVNTEVRLKRRMSIFEGPLTREIFNSTFFEKGYDHTLLASVQLPEDL
jgi:hypothetical protein